MLTAIVGINWGDEGKGRMVDLLSREYDVVARYQGGNNAGHTVVNDQGKFILNLLPSGILRPEVVNVMGNGMVIDLKHLCGEMDRLIEAGVRITPENLKISERAIICMPYHVQQDVLEEDRLGDAKYGSTRRGIGPVYGDKYLKKCLRMGDLLYPETLEKRLAGIVEWKNLTIRGAYGADTVKVNDLMSWLCSFGGRLKPFICDTGLYLDGAAREGKNILFEAQLGALRDIDFGIYPYTSSSYVLSAYAPIGAGPFTAELFGEPAERLREAGGEYGAATGRPRRVGPFDAVASRYGVRVQGADCLALTKLDVLSYLKEIPICTGYEVDGVLTREFPFGDILNTARPVFETVEGWNCDISGCRRVSDLPRAAYDYIKLLEKLVGCPIQYVSVGPQRAAYLNMF